jgi:hypothetical protein
MPQGFVYILVSPHSSYIKIGGTENPISERLRAINTTEPYAKLGPWGLSDFLHVTDWPTVERGMHKHFKQVHVADVKSARELFKVAPHEARLRLRETDSALRVSHKKTLQTFKERALQLYLFKLFQFSGLFGNLDIQGAWTLSLLTTTVGGRWYTVNIGSHEVAFAGRQSTDGKYTHCLILDRLILEYPETIIWIGKHNGDVQNSEYSSSERAVNVYFDADFANAEKIFTLPGVRRALIAYWSEKLADLRERNAKSTYARYHSYDAVSELLNFKRANELVFSAITDLV